MKKKFVVWLSVWLSLCLPLVACSNGKGADTTLQASGRTLAQEQVDTAKEFHDGVREQIRRSEEAVAEAKRIADEQIAAAEAACVEGSECARRKAAAAAAAAKKAAERARAARASRSAPANVGGDVWGALARCESGGNPRAVGGGGRYFGAFQFSLGSWRAVGMSGNPIDYDYATQLAAAQRLQAKSGWGQWPHCSRRLGLR